MADNYQLSGSLFLSTYCRFCQTQAIYKNRIHNINLSQTVAHRISIIMHQRSCRIAYSKKDWYHNTMTVSHSTHPPHHQRCPFAHIYAQKRTSTTCSFTKNFKYIKYDYPHRCMLIPRPLIHCFSPPTICFLKRACHCYPCGTHRARICYICTIKNC